MQNPLLSALNMYFKEQTSLHGKIFVLNSFLNSYKADLNKRNTSDNELITAMLSFRDISKHTDENNCYSIGYQYTVSNHTLDDEIQIILSKEYCLTFAQAYEIFETFLVEIFTELFFVFPSYLVSLKLADTELSFPKESLRQYVKERLGKKNNKGYMRALRKMSKHFSIHEINNIYQINISNWFDLVSELRHNIVHNRQVISGKLKTVLKENREKRKLFRQFFDQKDTYDGTVIFLTPESFNTALDRLNEFAYFILKSLSSANSFDLVFTKFIETVNRY